MKVFSMFKKRSDLTYDEFSRYWKEVHGPTVARLTPGLRRYVQNHPVNVPGVESDIDGIAELWFDDLEALRNYWAWRHSDGKPVFEDGKNFQGPPIVTFFAEEHVIKEK